jgi:hypothetical protein
LIFELLWWCGEESASPPPTQITPRAMTIGAELVVGYFLPMAQRAYVEMSRTEQPCSAARLARWILRTRPTELHVRQFQRQLRVQGLRTAGEIHESAKVLVTAGWLRPPTQNTRFGPRTRVSYPVNPKLAAVERELPDPREF